MGFEVVEAANGRELFWALESHRRMDSLDEVIVLADVHMPVYGGLDVLEAWNQDDFPHAFIVMTGSPDEVTLRRAEELGATLLPKPFTSTALCELIQTLLR